MKQIILGLGSNLGDRKDHLRQAVQLIKARLLNDIIESNIHISPPLLLSDSPPEWQQLEFMNIVIAGTLKDLKIKPEEFLTRIKDIEVQLGRKPHKRWAPREIDIDILGWGDDIINLPNLQIPHSEMLKRDFVMKPLLEILPKWKHP